MAAGRIAAKALCVSVVALGGADLARAGEVTTFGGYKYVQHERFIEPGTTKTISAKCPGKTHVVGGGGESGGGFGETFMSSSFPFDGGDRDSKPDDGWKVTHTGFDERREIYADAVCARVKPVYRKHSHQVAGESSLEASLACGGERSILHGGLRGTPAVQPVASYPHDGGAANDAWRLTVHNVANQARTWEMHAICTDEIPVTYVSSAHDAASMTQDYGESVCPVNAPNAIGGGLVTSPSFGLFRWSSNAFELNGATRGWYVGVESESGAGAVPYTIWADCVPDVGSLP